jgi:uncharacterized membrane protein YphA (DoxX/SURF4 family)
MIKLIKPGRIIFAIGIIALGMLQFFMGDFIVGRPPAPAWSADIPGKLIWAYVSGSLFIVAALAVVFNKKAGIAAFFIGLMIMVCSFLLCHLPGMALDSWDGKTILWHVGAYKSLALAGGAWIVAASFFKEEGRSFNSFLSNHRLVKLGTIFLAIFLIVCGLSHFKFYDFVKNFILPFMHARSFWTYFTAIALLAGGVGLLIRPARKWAAALSGLMILLWFFLVHIPRAVNTPESYDEWMGVFESFSFSGMFFVLAGLFSKE